MNILYKSKYYDLLYVEHGLYAKHILGKYVDDIKKTMSKREKFNYWLYLKSGKGFKLGKKRNGMVYQSDRFKTMGSFIWAKHSYQLEFAELYYEIQT